MDMGIVNAGQLAVYDNIPAELRERCEDVVLNRREDGWPAEVCHAIQAGATYREVIDGFNSGGPAATLFPKAAYLGVTTDDVNIANETARAWYAVWLKATGRTDLIR